MTAHGNRQARSAASPDGVGRLLAGYTVEVLARDEDADQICRAHVAPGREVFIAFVPGDRPERLVETARRLARAGFRPLPHLVARGIESRAALDDLLGRLAGEAAVDRALVLGGDIDRPVGPFPSSLSLLQTGLFQRHGIGQLSLALYPEPHPKIRPEALDLALATKLERIQRDGLKPRLVSQFCFEAGPIIARIERLRAQGLGVPVRVGLAGPADRRTLWRYALHCGIGPSIRALGARTGVVARLLQHQSPDPVVTALAEAAARNPALGLEGIHLFTFGGVAEAAGWAEARREQGA